MQLKESLYALILNRWNILTTRSILNTTNPDRKKKGRMVHRSTIPSKEKRKRSTAFIPGWSGYRYSAVHIRRIYSMQNIITVTASIPRKTAVYWFNCSKVSINRIARFTRITITIKISKALLTKSFFLPVYMMSKIRFFLFSLKSFCILIFCACSFC